MCPEANSVQRKRNFWAVIESGPSMVLVAYWFLDLKPLKNKTGLQGVITFQWLTAATLDILELYRNLLVVLTV